MKLFLFVVLGLAFASIGASQTSAPKPSFEVASIKPRLEGRPRIAPTPNGRFVATAVSLKGLTAHAYRGQLFQFASGASWIDSDLWDIEAKAPADAKITFNPFDLSNPDTMSLMVQSLLEDRFLLKAHHEMKEVPVYELTLAKGGLKMKLSADQSLPEMPDFGSSPSQRGGPIPRGIMRMGRGVLEVSAITFQNLVQTLSAISGRSVIDKTGLKGLYDVKLAWTPDAISGTSAGPFGPATPGTATPPSSDVSDPSLFAAIQEQLGLKLESAKGQVDMLVIDSVQKPRTN